MVHGHKSPIGNDTSDANLTVRTCRTSNEIFNGGSVEELDVGEGKDFGEKGRSKEGSVFNYNVVALILEWNAEIGEEDFCWLTHDHCGEELTTEPRATT